MALALHQDDHLADPSHPTKAGTAGPIHTKTIRDIHEYPADSLHFLSMPGRANAPELSLLGVVSEEKEVAVVGLRSQDYGSIVNQALAQQLLDGTSFPAFCDMTIPSSTIYPSSGALGNVTPSVVGDQPAV